MVSSDVLENSEWALVDSGVFVKDGEMVGLSDDFKMCLLRAALEKMGEPLEDIVKHALKTFKPDCTPEDLEILTTSVMLFHASISKLLATKKAE